MTEERINPEEKTDTKRTEDLLNRDEFQELLEKSLSDCQECRESLKREILTFNLGKFAHYFNNLFQIIRGEAQLMEQEKGSERDPQRYLDSIVDQTEKGAKIIQDFLTYLNLKNGSPQKREINILSLIEDIREYFPSIKEYPQQGDFLVWADPQDVKEIISELVKNAQEASPKDEEVLLLLEQDKDEKILTISDRGSGIMLEKQENIFDPFVSTKNFPERFGMGLAVVQGLVIKNELKIVLDSEPNKGTSISLVFPSC